MRRTFTLLVFVACNAPDPATPITRQATVDEL